MQDQNISVKIGSGKTSALGNVLVLGSQNMIVIGPSKTGKSSSNLISTINPVASIGKFPNGIIRWLQEASYCRLDFDAEDKAKEIALSISAEKEPTLKDLTNAWEKHTELKKFAAAIHKTMISNK